MAENSHLISKMPERETGLPNTYATLAITAYRYRSCAVWTYVACFRQSRHFEPFSGRFTPIRPTNPRCERKGLRSSWHPVNVGAPPSPWPLFSRLPPHAPRRDQRGQVIRKPSPAGISVTDRRIAKDRTRPDLDEHPLSYYVTEPSDSCGQIKQFFLFPLAADQPLTILSRHEALNATSSRRARRMAIRRNVCPFLDRF